MKIIDDERLIRCGGIGNLGERWNIGMEGRRGRVGGFGWGREKVVEVKIGEVRF